MTTRGERSGWASITLRGLEWVAYPIMIGAAALVLSLGVVTWLPGWAAAARAARRWLVHGDATIFATALREFPSCWRRLWRHSLVSTAIAVVLLLNVTFLVTRPERAAWWLLALQLGLAAVFMTYHVGLAAVSAGPEDPATWRRHAVVLAFGSWRGPLITATGVVAGVLGLPFLLGLPLAIGVPLVVAHLVRPTGPSGSTPRSVMTYA